MSLPMTTPTNELVPLQTRTSRDYAAMLSHVGDLKGMSTSATCRMALEDWGRTNYQEVIDKLLEEQAAQQKLLKKLSAR